MELSNVETAMKALEKHGGEKSAKRPRSKRELASGNEPDIALRVRSVMRAADRAGMLGEKSHRIGGRISPALVEQAKKQTGIEADSDLIEFALANIALDDDFGRVLREVNDTVSPDLKLGF